MQQLRGDKGCPWDKEQDHKSLVPFLIEETYEVVSAIEENEPYKIQEELGDLLLQIIFHCQIAQEEKLFTIEDVAKGIVEKLIRRHPHIFSDIKVKNSKEVLENWEEIKRQERAEKKDRGKSILEEFPKNLPALVEADLITKKVAKIGFDWPCSEEIIKKLEEEIEELKDALKKKDRKEIKEEIGDVLFTVVNLSRHLNLDAEYSLKESSKKFIKRFKRLEEIAAIENNNQSLKGKTLEELDRLWELAKKEENETR